MGLTNEFRPRISQRPNGRWSKLDTVSISTSSCGLKSYSCIRWSIIVCKITYFEKIYSIMYICYVYEVYMSLHLKSKTRTLFYHVIASPGCALASSLELWLPRNDDLLHLLCILRRTDKSGVSNRNWFSFSIQTLTSFSTMLLWSRNMFRRLLDHFPSWKIVIFRVKIFTRNTDAKDFILAMPTILFCLKGPKTSSHTVPREGCVVGCTLMRDKCSKSRPDHVAFRIVSKTSFTTIQAWILLPLPQTPGFCCPNISNQCYHFSKHNVICCNDNSSCSWNDFHPHFCDPKNVALYTFWTWLLGSNDVSSISMILQFRNIFGTQAVYHTFWFWPVLHFVVRTNTPKNVIHNVDDPNETPIVPNCRKLLCAPITTDIGCLFCHCIAKSTPFRPTLVATVLHPPKHYFQTL